MSFCREHLERGHEAYALRLLGELSMNNPDAPHDSEASFREAIARARELDLRPLLAQCYLGLGTRLRQVNRSQEADFCLSAASELFRALDVPFWLDRIAAALAAPP